MTFTVAHVQRDGGGVRLCLAGELDLSTAPRLTTAIDGLLADGQVRILVDLDRLTFCDSTGIAAFLRGDNACAEAGGWLRLTGATGRVDRILRMTGLAELLRYDPTADPASHAHH
ncbi:STAS domain-containing protein [Micromonospora echinospora]|uniref:STAS domain-containing protein n=1 Tax=Micromonospora echinospora TaxID=1877 RepID=UPI00366C954C